MKSLKLPKYYEQIIFFLVAALVVFVRLRYADMAMERDEGEYAYAGSQILSFGFPLLGRGVGVRSKHGNNKQQIN